MFYAPDVNPSLDLAVPILNISGLDDFSLPHPNLQPRPSNLTATATPNAGSGPSGSYLGGDFRAAYVQGTSLTGAGQSVGLLEFDGYYASDITSYETLAGLPNVTLSNVPVDGGVTNIGSGNSEVALDIDMVISMAPGISNVYVYEAPNTTGLWVDILSRMANDDLAKQLSPAHGAAVPPTLRPSRYSSRWPRKDNHSSTPRVILMRSPVPFRFHRKAQTLLKLEQQR